MIVYLPNKVKCLFADFPSGRLTADEGAVFDADGLVAVGTVYSAYVFGKDIGAGNWLGTYQTVPDLRGSARTGRSALGSNTLVGAEKVVGAPAAVIGSAYLG